MGWIGKKKGLKGSVQVSAETWAGPKKLFDPDFSRKIPLVNIPNFEVINTAF